MTEERRILYIDTHLYPLLDGESEYKDDVYEVVVDDIRVYLTHLSFRGLRLLGERTFDMLGLHLSTNGACLVARAFREEHDDSSIVVWSTLPTRDSRRLMDEIDFLYDSVRFDYGLSGLDEKLREVVGEFRRGMEDGREN